MTGVELLRRAEDAAARWKLEREDVLVCIENAITEARIEEDRGEISFSIDRGTGEMRGMLNNQPCALASFGRIDRGLAMAVYLVSMGEARRERATDAWRGGMH